MQSLHGSDSCYVVAGILQRWSVVGIEGHAGCAIVRELIKLDWCGMSLSVTRLLRTRQQAVKVFWLVWFFSAVLKQQ